jgi:predicted transcriptional regulator
MYEMLEEEEKRERAEIINRGIEDYENGKLVDGRSAISNLKKKLDEAVNDMENGRVISEEDMWSRLANVGAVKKTEDKT